MAAFEAHQAPWRNTALPTMLWWVEGYAALPLILWLTHISWPTFWLAVACVTGLTGIRYFGLDARSAYRLAVAFLIRVMADGHIRATARHWSRSH